MTRKPLLIIAAACLFLALDAPAQTGYLSSILVDGVVNGFEDQSREVFFDRSDVNGPFGGGPDGIFGVGDILTGFVRIDNKTAPDGVDLNNQVYAIFSQEITSVDDSDAGSAIRFGPVTPGLGLTLTELGVAGAAASDMVAVFSRNVPFSTNLILNSPGDRVGAGGVTMADYLDLILKEGTLELTAGLSDGPFCTGGDSDCFQATSVLAGASVGTLATSSSSITIANFIAGLETSIDPAGWLLTDAVTAGFFAPPAGPFSVNELVISNGAVRGAVGVANSAEWTDGSELSSLIQCGADSERESIPCGFVNDADFVLIPKLLLACRFTGGGVDTDLNWDGTLEDGSMRRGNGAGNLPDNIDRYQMGGQAGANTGAQPQPKGEWTHHQQTGPSGSFTFHAGTASAPVGTEIDKITCTDPDHCVNARPAPAKQLDFEGVGTFKTVGRGSRAPVWGLDDQNQQVVLPFIANVDVGRGNRGYNGTYHWFEVNIDDLGEPRVQNTTPIENCPTLGFGVNGDPADPLNVVPADCGCPDFYRIKIYNGVYADGSGNITPNKADLIYEAYGYLDGGNLQIHPPTGFDTN